MTEKKVGFIDKRGNFVIEPNYDRAGYFHEGLAWICIDDKYGYIDKTGRHVLKPGFLPECIGCGSFYEGRAHISAPYKMGVIDTSGRLIGHYYQNIYDFHEGLALVKAGGEYGFINRNGDLIIRPQFEEALDFHEGLAQVVFNAEGDNPKYGFIDKTGNIVIEPKFKFGLTDFSFSEGLAVGVQGNGRALNPSSDKFGYIDKTGKFVIKPKLNFSAHSFSEGLAYVKSGDKKGFIDKTGRFTFTLSEEIDLVYGFSEGLAPVHVGQKWGYIDITGNMVIEPQFDYVRDFKEGLACVCIDFNLKKYGFIDKTGTIVIEPQFDSEADFREGFASVKIEQEAKPKPIFVPEPPAPKQKNKSGCYIATAVYGSYDCPEVWTLRRFRDTVLDKFWCGRLFVKYYYAISPTIVKWFGQSNLFRKLLYMPLNQWVKRLNKQGFKSTPYEDKY